MGASSTLATRHIANVSRQLHKQWATLHINYAYSSILWATATYVHSELSNFAITLQCML